MMTGQPVNLKRVELENWLGTLSASFTLIAPRREQNAVFYRKVESQNEITWDYIRPLMSLKEVLFPPSESLFTLKKNGKGVKIEESIFRDEQVVWGVRSCDARAIEILDAMFIADDPVDPFYARRRKQTTLVGLACREKGPTCFCDEAGGALDAPEGLDILVHEMEEGYKFEAITEKGVQLMNSTGFEDISLVLDPGGDMARTWLHLPDLLPRMADPYWQDTAERCLSCRICSYVCPTCRCFDVRDEALYSSSNTAVSYERIRYWDSCAGENYRCIGGGHHPRAEKGDRLRNRFLCKFYYYPQQYNLGTQIACTGCGRCIDACPVNIDISEVIAYIQARF